MERNTSFPRRQASSRYGPYSVIETDLAYFVHVGLIQIDPEWLASLPTVTFVSEVKGDDGGDITILFEIDPSSGLR